MISYFPFQDKITPNQKKRISNFKKPATHKMKKDLGCKNKYWCPINKTWYLATKSHWHCKECWNEFIDDQHEVILYNPKIHKEEE